MSHPSRLETRRQVVQDASILLSARGHDRQHPLHEATALSTICPAANATPDHGVALGMLRRVIRRRDASDSCKGPQALLYPEDLGATAGRRRTGSPRSLLAISGGTGPI